MNHVRAGTGRVLCEDSVLQTDVRINQPLAIRQVLRWSA